MDNFLNCKTRPNVANMPITWYVVIVTFKNLRSLRKFLSEIQQSSVWYLSYAHS